MVSARALLSSSESPLLLFSWPLIALARLTTLHAIVQAAFVDDILSLVALTMLLQIGVAESTGQELSLWAVLKPLVFSVLFCVGGALMAMPIKRGKDDGLVKSKLLRWIGIFPEFVPAVMVWFGHRGHEHHHYAEDLQEEQDKVLTEYGAKLEETAGKILAAFKRDPFSAEGDFSASTLMPTTSVESGASFLFISVIFKRTCRICPFPPQIYDQRGK